MLNKYKFDLGRSRHLKESLLQYLSGCVIRNIKIHKPIIKIRLRIVREPRRYGNQRVMKIWPY